MFEKLGITWQSMLFHLIAILVLVIGLTIILYKPMKRLIANHQRKLDEVFHENRTLNLEVSEVKSKYEGMIVEIKDEAMRVSTEAAKKAEIHAEEIIRDAQEKADNILSDAKREALVSRQRVDNEFKTTISRMAVEVAGKILEREVSEKDNKTIIDTYLNEWEK